MAVESNVWDDFVHFAWAQGKGLAGLLKGTRASANFWADLGSDLKFARRNSHNQGDGEDGNSDNRCSCNFVFQ